MVQLDIYFVNLDNQKKNIINFFQTYSHKNILLNYSFDIPKNIFIKDYNIPSYYIYYKDEMIKCSSKL